MECLGRLRTLFQHLSKRDINYQEPIFAYPRQQGISVIGGHVYRKDPHSSFHRVYIFGDHQSRRVWGLTQKNRKLEKFLHLAICPEKIVSFAPSEQGDLFIVGYEGTIFQLNFSQSEFEAAADLPVD